MQPRSTRIPLKQPVRLAVFASGGGTNLQALLDHFNAADSSIARVQLVISNRSDAGALERAREAGVATEVVDASSRECGRHLLSVLEEARIDLIVLAGYLKLVPLPVVERFAGHMINIHPALLPAFGGPGLYGLRVHRAVLASGARVSGATVHLVTEHYDEGRILGQWPVPVLPGDTEEALAARVLQVEHLLLPVVIEALADDAPASTAAGAYFRLHDQPAPASDQIQSLLDFSEIKD